ncbi:hypothetical protein COCOBI_15-1600 [Coccomyxa sp. Obi]|nr:hypothetical protein COCOBI_15-1600 [Coccomyxa sp. Obi]
MRVQPFAPPFLKAEAPPFLDTLVIVGGVNTAGACKALGGACHTAGPTLYREGPAAKRAGCAGDSLSSCLDENPVGMLMRALVEETGEL